MSIGPGASISVQNVSWSVQGVEESILHPVSFTLLPGKILGVLGPNGSGKTTLLRLLYRFHRPTSGTVSIDGQDLWKQPARNVARKVAVVLQEKPTEFALTVRNIVALGRFPHKQGLGAQMDEHDEEVIEAALQRLDLQALTNRRLDTLSGGEHQRVMVARTLAQEPCLLILDEPTNHLDIRHQLEVIELIRDLPLTIVTSLHNLNMAASVCDDILLLKDGRSLGFGPPSKVLSEDNLSYAYNVTVRRERLAPSDSEHLTFHLSNKGSPHETNFSNSDRHFTEHRNRKSRNHCSKLQPHGELRSTAKAGSF